MLSSIIAAIVGKLTVGGLTAGLDRLAGAYEKKLAAANDKDRIAAERDIATIEAEVRLLIAEQGSWMTRWVRPAFAAIFVIYDAKIVVWDKVLALGTTDALPPEFWQLQMIVVGAFFVTRVFEKSR